MKKTFALMLVLIITAALFITACGAENAPAGVTAEPAAEERPPETEAPAETEVPKETEAPEDAEISKTEPPPFTKKLSELEFGEYRAEAYANEFGMKKPEGISTRDWFRQIREERIRRGFSGEDGMDTFYDKKYVELSRTDEENGIIANDDGTVTDVIVEKTFESSEKAWEYRSENGITIETMNYWVFDQYLPVLYRDCDKNNAGKYYLSVKDMMDARKGIKISYPEDTIVFKKYYDGIPFTPFAEQ